MKSRAGRITGEVVRVAVDLLLVAAVEPGVVEVLAPGHSESPVLPAGRYTDGEWWPLVYPSAMRLARFPRESRERSWVVLGGHDLGS
jgi:hypothetical protein